ncbi:MAG: hypothetical protein QXV17_04865 [Candidatus Micrarchaeaceae archaeon]
MVRDPPGNYAHHRISQDRHENERKERFNNDEGYVPYSSIRMGVQDTISYALRNEYLVLIDTIRRAQSRHMDTTSSKKNGFNTDMRVFAA